MHVIIYKIWKLETFIIWLVLVLPKLYSGYSVRLICLTLLRLVPSFTLSSTSHVKSPVKEKSKASTSEDVPVVQPQSQSNSTVQVNAQAQAKPQSRDQTQVDNRPNIKISLRILYHLNDLIGQDLLNLTFYTSKK